MYTIYNLATAGTEDYITLRLVEAKIREPHKSLYPGTRFFYDPTEGGGDFLLPRDLPDVIYLTDEEDGDMAVPCDEADALWVIKRTVAS